MANQDIGLIGNDLNIVDGDLTIMESDMQHVADTLNAFPGWWKENPADGVGIFQYLNSVGQEQAIKRAININLQSDGYNASNPIVYTNSDGQLVVNPNATATNDNL